jgi:hypothetical protein
MAYRSCCGRRFGYETAVGRQPPATGRFPAARRPGTGPEAQAGPRPQFDHLCGGGAGRRRRPRPWWFRAVVGRRPGRPTRSAGATVDFAADDVRPRSGGLRRHNKHVTVHNGPATAGLRPSKPETTARPMTPAVSNLPTTKKRRPSTAVERMLGGRKCRTPCCSGWSA